MLALFLSSIATLLFGLYSIYISQKNDKTNKKLRADEEELARKLFEASILAKLSSEIGYTLNTEYISKIIAETAEDLYDVSTASYVVVGDKKITISTIYKENLPDRYSDSLKEIIIGSLNNIDENTTSFTTVFNRENDYESSLSLLIDIVPQSYFNVPLIVENQLVGLINISSRKKGAYQDKDMSILYKIVNSATQAVEKLRDVIETEEGRLEGLISGISSGVVLLSFGPSGLYIQNINNSAKEFLRISENADFYSVLKGFGEFDLKSKLDEVIKDKKSIFFSDTKINNRFFKIFLNPVFSHRGAALIGATITLRDITLEKEVEALRQNFMSMVVHELRSPLTSIKGASEMLAKKDLNTSDKEKMVEVIKDASETMLSEVSDLLDASKIEAGKLAINRSENDLNKLIHERAEAFSYLAHDKGLKVNLNLEVGIPKFDFDGERVGQVINNLLSNAIKFTLTGGIITIASAARMGQVTISISDTGIGIADEKKGLLFSKFGQTGQIFNKDSTGLGLYISKGIIESHGGKIWVESETGKGTNVYFTLPVVKEGKFEENVQTENIPQEFQQEVLVN